mmetsp:Transcript_47165/g.79004  ORF Transcript_47165/g.79004 Transcript_47165/m.79004 type:complete len:209 (-) Transcript_47165:687-1313(-)
MPKCPSAHSAAKYPLGCQGVYVKSCSWLCEQNSARCGPCPPKRMRMVPRDGRDALCPSGTHACGALATSLSTALGCFAHVSWAPHVLTSVGRNRVHRRTQSLFLCTPRRLITPAAPGHSSNSPKSQPLNLCPKSPHAQAGSSSSPAGRQTANAGVPGASLGLRRRKGPMPLKTRKQNSQQNSQWLTRPSHPLVKGRRRRAVARVGVGD